MIRATGARGNVLTLPGIQGRMDFCERLYEFFSCEDPVREIQPCLFEFVCQQCDLWDVHAVRF